jgi:hypothetical protein
VTSPRAAPAVASVIVFLEYSSMLDLYRLTWELSDLASCAARFRQGHADPAEDRTDWEILSGSRLCSSS